MSLTDTIPIPRARKRTLIVLALILVSALIGLLLAPSGSSYLSTAVGRGGQGSKVWHDTRRGEDFHVKEQEGHVDSGKYLRDLKIAKGAVEDDGVASEDRSTYNRNAAREPRMVPTAALHLSILVDTTFVHIGQVRGKRLYKNIYELLVDHKFPPQILPQVDHLGDIQPKVIYDTWENGKSAYVRNKGRVEVYCNHDNFKDGPDRKLAVEIISRIFELASRAIDNCFDVDFPGSRRTTLCKMPKHVEIRMPIHVDDTTKAGVMTVELVPKFDAGIDFDLVQYNDKPILDAIPAKFMYDWADQAAEYVRLKPSNLNIQAMSGEQKCFLGPSTREDLDYSKCSLKDIRTFNDVESRDSVMGNSMVGDSIMGDSMMGDSMMGDSMMGVVQQPAIRVPGALKIDTPSNNKTIDTPSNNKTSDHV